MVKSKGGARVFLVHGEEDGRAAWYFVHVDKVKVAIFEAMMKDGDYSLGKVGKILHSGWGDSPPDDIRVKIQQQYG